MKFFIISEGGDGAGLALKLQDEGHDVRIWIRDDEAADRCKGLVQHDDGFVIDLDTIILADCTGSGILCDAYREAGHAVIGGSVVADRLESDRDFATSIFRATGIKTPKTKFFDSWDEARTFVESNEERLVFKPEGDLSGVVPSYVSSDQEDMLAMLEHFEAEQRSTVPAFALQQFIEGTCVSSEAWFNGSSFLRPFNHTIERKQLMNGDLGPSGGCSGNVVWGCFDEECPLCKALLWKLEEFLSNEQYIGPIDVNAVVGEDGIFALEFTPRLGYDATPTLLCALLDTPLGVFFSELVLGETSGTMPLLQGFAAGVRVTVPPWPSEKFSAAPGLLLRGIKTFDKFYPYDVMESEGEFVTSGGYGITGVALGTGDKIDDAFENAYKVANKLRLPDKQYRTDLAEVCQKDYRWLSSYMRAVGSV